MGPVHAAGIKALVMFGGAGSIDGFRATSDPAKRASVVANLKALVLECGFDGLDLDWEPLDPDLDAASSIALVQALQNVRALDGLAQVRLARELQRHRAEHPHDREADQRAGEDAAGRVERPHSARPLASSDHGPDRRAHAVGVAKDKAGLGEPIEVRRLNGRVTQGVDGVGPLIVGEQEEDVGLLRRIGCRGSSG